MSIRLPRCVLFDLDGTLLDSIPGIAYSIEVAFHAAGLPQPPLDLRRRIGPPIRTILSQIAATTDPVLLDTLEHAFRVSYDTEGWRKTAFFSGVPEILARMKSAGHKLFIVSNKPRHVSCKTLEMEGISSHFEQIYTRDSADPPYASKAAMVRALMDDYHLASRDCVMVGDTMEDASAAALQNVSFVFMEHGYGELSLAQPVLLRLAGFSEFAPYLTVENISDR